MEQGQLRHSSEVVALSRSVHAPAMSVEGRQRRRHPHRAVQPRQDRRGGSARRRQLSEHLDVGSERFDALCLARRVETCSETMQPIDGRLLSNPRGDVGPGVDETGCAEPLPRPTRASPRGGLAAPSRQPTARWPLRKGAPPPPVGRRGRGRQPPNGGERKELTRASTAISSGRMPSAMSRGTICATAARPSPLVSISNPFSVADARIDFGTRRRVVPQQGRPAATTSAGQR